MVLTMQAVSANGTYRYVRYVAPDNSYGNIAELQVFGRAAPPAPRPLPHRHQRSTRRHRVGQHPQQATVTTGTRTRWRSMGARAPSLIHLTPAATTSSSISARQWRSTQIAYAPRVGYESRMTGGVIEVSNDATFATGVQTLYHDQRRARRRTDPTIGHPRRHVPLRPLHRSGQLHYGNIAELQVFGPSATPPPSNPTTTQLTGTPVGQYIGQLQQLRSTYLKAFDGDTNTYFDSPDASGNYVQLDLGTVRSISQIAYAPRSGFAARMIGGIFEASNRRHLRHRRHAALYGDVATTRWIDNRNAEQSRGLPLCAIRRTRWVLREHR